MASEHSRRYNRAHKRLRHQWDVKVRAGGVRCARCHQPIAPHDEWDLGHPDGTPGRSTAYAPEHAICNRATSAHRVARTRGTPPSPGTPTPGGRGIDPNPPPGCANSEDHARLWAAGLIYGRQTPPPGVSVERQWICTSSGGGRGCGHTSVWWERHADDYQPRKDRVVVR
jgi:hypothetical protein